MRSIVETCRFACAERLPPSKSRVRFMNNKGVVDEYRRRKLSYEVVKKWYGKGPAIAKGGTYSLSFK